jgi:CRP/FNR family transcriptional regulator
VDPVPVLTATRLFAGVPADQLEALLPAVRLRNYARDSYLFHEGDAGTQLYVVVSGQVKVSRLGRSGDEAVFAMLLPGDVLGELALFDDSAMRTSDAQAVEATECLTLSREAVVGFLLARPQLMLRIIAMLSGYVRRKDDAFAEVAFLDITGRVAQKLLDLAETNGQATADGVRIGMRLSQRALAGMVGASRENVNRALSRFAATGVIRHEGGAITILDPAALRRRV